MNTLPTKNEPTACKRCHDTGKAPRPKTADHILTDTEPWEYCNCFAGRILRKGEAVPEPAWRAYRVPYWGIVR